MLGHILPENPVDVIEIQDPDRDHKWYFDLSFLMSNWSCIFGDGCAGIHSVDSPTYSRDTGCCTRGCWLVKPDDLANVEKHYEMLTDDDWDKELRAVVEKKGTWQHVLGNPTRDKDGNVVEINIKSRVYEGACVFANRLGNSSGKIGCAFHALADRLGVSHVETKPEVCWQLPLFLNGDDDETFISRWDRRAWGGINDDGSQSWLNWWCVDSPEAYVGTEPVYRYMEQEMRRICGDKVYELFVIEAEKRKDNYIAPMPGTQINDGKPLLPLIVLDKKPVR